MCTLSRTSTRLSASDWLSGGEQLGDCSFCDDADTMKGIRCDSIPSFTRSSGATGGKSDERPPMSVDYSQDVGNGTHSMGLEPRWTWRFSRQRRVWGEKVDHTLTEAVLVIHIGPATRWA